MDRDDKIKFLPYDNIEKKEFMTKDFYFYDDDIIGKHIQKYGVWEREVTQFLQKNIKENIYSPYNLCNKSQLPIEILDIGAHVGYFSVFFARPLKYKNNKLKIHAFEPNKHIFTLLEANTVVHYNNIITHNYGIGKDNLDTILYCSYNNTGDNSTSIDEIKEYNDDWFELKCKIKTLDNFDINWKDVRYVKIDTQGTEHEIFKEVFSRIDREAEQPVMFIVEDNYNTRKWLKSTKTNYKKIMYDLIFEL